MQVELCDRVAQAPVAAEITPLTNCHSLDIYSNWVPAFERRYQMRERDEDFLMWKPGAGSLELLTQRAGLQSFALIAAGKVQGVLFLQDETQLSRLEPPHSLVYVRYLATAPWNRRGTKCPAGLGGVGTLLMAQAVRVSRHAGCDGRIGLHSLRGCDGFYRLLGLQNLGLDAARRGMNYFELSCLAATRFSEERGLVQVSDEDNSELLKACAD